MIITAGKHIMGILNCTPDSFFSASRKRTEEDIRERVHEIIAQGGDIIDVGACSTRPDGEPVGEKEEMERLRFAMPIVKEAVALGSLSSLSSIGCLGKRGNLGGLSPRKIALSVDTFRADVARMCVEEFGDMIINDVSEGSDLRMFQVVAELGVPYVLTSNKGTLRDMTLSFAEKVQRLRDLGAKDIILDPGFGFGKTIEQNFRIMRDLSFLREFDLPILVGFSRKSMIYKTLGVTPYESLNGTTVLNTIALTHDAADILRVHDVRAAKEVIDLCTAY